MKFNEIIRAALKSTGTTQQKLGDRLGVRQTAVSNVLQRDEIMLGTFVEYLDAMGYDIIIRKDGEEMKLTNDNS